MQKSWLENENAFHLRPPIFALYETLKFLWGTRHAKGMKKIQQIVVGENYIMGERCA